MRLDLAIEEWRYSLGTGLQAGEGVALITRRAQELFADPQRAFRIAVTESSRAQHGGQYEAARESGVVRKLRWTASSDACDLCLSLDGKEVDFDEPFYVNPKGGPYAVCYHPPVHPHDMCSVVEVL